MTILVTVEQEADGHVMRRWARGPSTEGRLVQTHEGGVEGYLYSHTVRDFYRDPSNALRVGFENETERSWHPGSAA